MSITTVSARDFARNLATTKQAAISGPVFITDRGKPVFALLQIEDYYRLAGEGNPQSLLEVMDAIPCPPGIAFEAPRLDDQPREADFS